MAATCHCLRPQFSLIPLRFARFCPHLSSPSCLPSSLDTCGRKTTILLPGHEEVGRGNIAGKLAVMEETRVCWQWTSNLRFYQGLYLSQVTTNCVLDGFNPVGFVTSWNQNGDCASQFISSKTVKGMSIYNCDQFKVLLIFMFVSFYLFACFHVLFMFVLFACTHVLFNILFAWYFHLCTVF